MSMILRIVWGKGVLWADLGVSASIYLIIQ